MKKIGAAVKHPEDYCTQIASSAQTISVSLMAYRQK